MKHLEEKKLVWLENFGLVIFLYPCPINGFFPFDLQVVHHLLFVLILYESIT